MAGEYFHLAVKDSRLLCAPALDQRAMTLILAAVTLIMLLFCIDQNKKMRAVFMDNRRKIAGVNSRVQDSLAGIRVVKSFANEELEQKKFEKSNLEFLDSKEPELPAHGQLSRGE